MHAAVPHGNAAARADPVQLVPAKVPLHRHAVPPPRQQVLFAARQLCLCFAELPEHGGSALAARYVRAMRAGGVVISHAGQGERHAADEWVDVRLDEPWQQDLVAEGLVIDPHVRPSRELVIALDPGPHVLHGAADGDDAPGGDGDDRCLGPGGVHRDDLLRDVDDLPEQQDGTETTCGRGGSCRGTEALCTCTAHQLRRRVQLGAAGTAEVVIAVVTAAAHEAAARELPQSAEHLQRHQQHPDDQPHPHESRQRRR